MVDEEIEAGGFWGGVESDHAGIAEAGEVGECVEAGRPFGVEGELWFAQSACVVVSGDHDDFFVLGDLFEEFGEFFVLPVYVRYFELFILFGIDSYAINHISGDDEVFCFCCLFALFWRAGFSADPCKEFFEFFFEEEVAADVDVGDDCDVCFFIAFFVFVGERYVWNDD